MKLRNYFKKYFDAELAVILTIFYLITICLNLIKVFSTSYLKGTPLVQGENFFFQIYVLDAITVLGIMVIIAMHTKRLILKRTSWRKILLFHFFLALILGVAIQFITDVYRLQVGLLDAFDFKKSLNVFLSVMDINFLVYFAMLFIIYTYYYFSIIRASEKQKSLLETQVVTARMNMLTSQLQPHFLFNTINCIIGLIDVDKRKAQDTLVDLSNFFREVTKNSNVHFFTVAKEMRFPENLTILEHIDAELLEERFPQWSFSL
jgi:two-component system, LytTR family, sensor kinase